MQKSETLGSVYCSNVPRLPNQNGGQVMLNCSAAPEARPGWRCKQKVAVKLSGKKVVIQDWEP
jgi:hypothetical protein